MKNNYKIKKKKNKKITEKYKIFFFNFIIIKKNYF